MGKNKGFRHPLKRLRRAWPLKGLSLATTAVEFISRDTDKGHGTLHPARSTPQTRTRFTAFDVFRAYASLRGRRTALAKEIDRSRPNYSLRSPLRGRLYRRSLASLGEGRTARSAQMPVGYRQRQNAPTSLAFPCSLRRTACNLPAHCAARDTTGNILHSLSSRQRVLHDP